MITNYSGTSNKSEATTVTTTAVATVKTELLALDTDTIISTRLKVGDIIRVYWKFFDKEDVASYPCKVDDITDRSILMHYNTSDNSANPNHQHFQVGVGGGLMFCYEDKAKQQSSQLRKKIEDATRKHYSPLITKLRAHKATIAKQNYKRAKLTQ